MAHAKFLEEALSTDVDESAVSALVGSLETQLGTASSAIPEQSTLPVLVHQNHVSSSVANGDRNSSLKLSVANGSSETVCGALNSDQSKSTGAEQPAASANLINVRSVTPPTAYANQLGNNVGVVQANSSNTSKSQDGVKIAFINNQSAPVTNSVGRVFTAQTSSLPNGSVTSNISSLPSSSNLSSTVSSASTNVNKSNISQSNLMDQSKPMATAVVIKSNSSQGIAQIPSVALANTNTIAVTTASSVPGIVTLAKPLSQAVGSQQTTAIVGGTPQIIPSNVQILNMNAIRPSAPTQSTSSVKVPQRVVLSQQVVGNRPVQPGQITLQAFQGLAPGTQGHLLLKTENGQYQLLRVGPAPSPATTPPTPFRVLPQQQAAAVTAPASAVAATTQPSQTATVIPAQQSSTPPVSGATTGKAVVDQTKEKCRKFLANLLELSSREPKAVERNVRTLIQELVNAKVEPEQFCDKLEKLLNASPQPCLIGFLKKSLPLLRQSMVKGELSIEGINPPPASVVYSTPIVTSSTQSIQMATATQMRVITQPTAIRPGQPVQQRIITMATAGGSGATVAGSQGGAKVTAAGPTLRLAPPLVRPNITTVRTPTGPTAIALRPGQTLTKTQFTTRPVLAPNKPASPLISASTTTGLHQFVINKPNQQLGKKPQSSSSAYTGDDDLNDVATMGGVNLAEESQRILGSTEFVGTQIRSCKDEHFLETGPLRQKIAEIAAKHNIDEPGPEIAALISHACQERLRLLIEKLGAIAEHRIDMNKFDTRYEVVQDIRGQLKCLEEVDRAEKKRHEEMEREMLLRAAKSRSKPEDPEQAKLKAKAREMQRAEMEELRQREANVTALLAIGPRKRPRMDNESAPSPQEQFTTPNRPNMAPRARVKRVTMRDLIFLLEQEKETRKSDLLFKAFFK